MINEGLNCILTNTNELPRVISDETRQKISKTRINNKSSKGENNPNYGKTHSLETKEKIRKSQLGKKHSEEHRKKISVGNKGKLKGIAFTETHCKNISKSKFGVKLTEKHKQKISFAFKGAKHPLAKTILDTQTGFFYYHVAEAAQAYQLKVSTLTGWLNGRYFNKSNLIYV